MPFFQIFRSLSSFNNSEQNISCIYLIQGHVLALILPSQSSDFAWPENDMASGRRWRYALMVNKIVVISKILLLFVFLCTFLALSFLFQVTFFSFYLSFAFNVFFPSFSAPLNLLLSLSFPSESQTSRPNKTVLITAQLIPCPSLYTRSYQPPQHQGKRKRKSIIFYIPGHFSLENSPLGNFTHDCELSKTTNPIQRCLIFIRIYFLSFNLRPWAHPTRRRGQ